MTQVISLRCFPSEHECSDLTWRSPIGIDGEAADGKQSPIPDVFRRWKRHARWPADQAATSIQNAPMEPFAQTRKVACFYRLVIGWRRSADRARLRANSLLTGNFTGNFAILGAPSRFFQQETAALQRLFASSL
jgi:hypothetical protein